jgi:hypothetical protein
MIPDPFHLTTTHRISILLEPNQVTRSSLLQTITIAFLSMAISMGDMAGNPSSPAGSAATFAVGGSRGEASASSVTSPLAPAEKYKQRSN